MRTAACRRRHAGLAVGRAMLLDGIGKIGLAQLGIAYDAERDRLFVTGKQWPKLFEIRLLRAPPP
jgi:hypothetical protein